MTSIRLAGNPGATTQRSKSLPAVCFPVAYDPNRNILASGNKEPISRTIIFNSSCADASIRVTPIRHNAIRKRLKLIYIISELIFTASAKACKPSDLWKNPTASLASFNFSLMFFG
jgi:hypothetical protein